VPLGAGDDASDAVLGAVMRFPRLLRAHALAAAVLGLATSGAIVTSAAPTAAADVSIVYVDIDDVIDKVDEGLAAREKLKEEQALRQKTISARESELKRLQDELERQAKAFSKDALERKAAQYEKALVDYQQMLQKFNVELRDKERELFDPIEKRLKELLRKVANRDGYDMILSKRSVPYGRKDLDLTDKVIQEYNQAHPVAKKPGAAASSSVAPKKPAAPAPSVAPKMQ
jgi:outer membrane protein